MFILGVLIALGAAAAFAVLGLLALYGGARATTEQLVPGFVPDRPSGGERALALLAVWVPVAFVTVFGVYSAIRIVEMVVQALS